jgi:hypothetical protein
MKEFLLFSFLLNLIATNYEQEKIEEKKRKKRDVEKILFLLFF